MRNQYSLIFIAAIVFFLSPILNFAQAPNLGAAANLVFFTSSGAVTNNGVSHINGGDIGTNSGAISGFDSNTISGKIHNADALTGQASKDLLTAYNQMLNTVPTISNHANAFGGGEILIPGVYKLSGAVSVAGTLTLDGQNNINSVFIFKTSAGAFTTGDHANIVLINGASACNVAWVIDGAISFAAYANMQGTFISNNGAFSMVAGSTLIGRGYSTTGAISVNAVTVSIPSQCSDFIATKWIGNNSNNSDWNVAGNWNNLIVPIASSKITIPFGALPYPVIDSGLNNVLSMTIDSGATITITGIALKIGGQINNSGTFDASKGTIELNGISPQSIAVNTFANNNLLNLIVSNKVTLLGRQNITGTLSFGNSKDSLFTGDSLTLKSTALGTARLADITKGDTLSGNVIIGKVTVERYIPAKRSWRLLSVPFSAVDTPSINTAWQEGQGGNSTSNLNPNPGYGVQITGGAAANGFDQGVNGSSSLKVYNNSTNSFTGLPAASGTNIPITSYPAYFLFVRGDRSTNLLLGTAAALTPATLRIKGQVFTGDTTIYINATNPTLVGNPYPSAIDFHALIKNNVNDKMYVWDPKINAVGGYVVLSWNNGGYDKTSSTSTGISQYIQSGEAFFVESSDGIKAGSLIIKEKNKNAGGSDNVFREMTTSKKLRVDLFAIDAAGKPALSDGTLTTYNDENSNTVDKNDAKKMYNIAENICIGREGKDLAIERRKTIADYDTTFLHLYTLKKQTYQLQITAEGLDSMTLHAVIKDNYSGTAKDTALNMGGVTNIRFSVNTDTASYAVNRFSIVFKQDVVVLPVTFSLVKADRVLKDIVVEWKVENELKIKDYEVEISYDGINFTEAFSLSAQANNGSSQTYSWSDKYVADAIHYYRIKCIDINGKYIYSAIVNVLVNKGVNEKNIVVCGNVLKDNQIVLRFNNIDKGSYYLKLYAVDGNVVKQFFIEHPGGSNTQNFIINSYFPSGKYEIILSGKNVNYKTRLIKD